MPTNEPNNRIWSLLETLLLVAAASGIFLAIGRRDQVIQTNTTHIAELRSIATDLVRSQVLSEAADGSHMHRMKLLEQRVTRLESSGD